MNSHSYSHPLTSSTSDAFTHLRAFLKSILKAKLKHDVIMRSVTRALALKPRGGIPHDVLEVHKLSAQIQVEWVARDIHPWDRDLPEEQKAELFVHQCLEDVDAAIVRLFRELPEIDVIEISVMEPRSKAKLIGGVVNRADILTSSNSPIGVKLIAMGLHYRRSNAGFEPIP